MRTSRAPVLLSLLAAFTLMTCVFAPAALAETVILTTTPADLVLDESAKILYVTSGSKILRISTTSHEQTTPIQLGGLLGGIDQSPDGRFLAVADRSKSGDKIGVFLVDLLSGTNRRIAYEAEDGVTGVHSVAFGSDGAVYFTVAGDNWQPLRRYNIASGTTYEVMTVHANTMLTASGNRRFIGMVTPLMPSGVYRFDVETHAVASAQAPSVHREIGLSADGNRIAVPGYQRCSFFDQNMSGIGFIAGYSTGFPVTAAYSAPDRLWIMPWGNSGMIRVADTSGYVLPKFWAANTVFEVPHSPYSQGRIRVSSDGTSVYVATSRGILFLDRRPQLRLDMPPVSTVGYGASLTMKGVTPSEAATITLEVSANGRTWTPTTSARAVGGCTFSVSPRTRTFYRLRYPGNGLLAPGISDSVAVLPRARLSALSAPASAKRERAFSASGTIYPMHPEPTSVRLYFYRYERGKWRLRKTTATAAQPSGSGGSRFSARVSLPSKGKWRFRAYHCDSGHGPSYSGFRKILVK